MTLADRINVKLTAQGGTVLSSDEIQCLSDPERRDEAVAILARMRARLGGLPLDEGRELGTVFTDEDEARQAAAQQASKYEAVCIEEMATDDGRSYGSNEYRILLFSGPDAVLAAASHPMMLTYWVGGREQGN